MQPRIPVQPDPRDGQLPRTGPIYEQAPMAPPEALDRTEPLYERRPAPLAVDGEPVVTPVAPAMQVRRPSNVIFRRTVYFIAGVIEILIAIRVVMRLLAANPDAGFSQLIYGVTYPFVALFQGVFPNPGGSGSVLELSSLLAILIYALLAWGIVRAMRLTPRVTV